MTHIENGAEVGFYLREINFGSQLRDTIIVIFLRRRTTTSSYYLLTVEDRESFCSGL